MTDQVARETGIPIFCEVSGKQFELNQTAGHELMMMTREAVYNAVLHGKPSKVEIKVYFGRKDLILEVRDDGRGFDPSRGPSDGIGRYGLLGMQERVRSVGGHFKLETALGKGTVAKIQISRRLSSAHNAGLSA